MIAAPVLPYSPGVSPAPVSVQIFPGKPVEPNRVLPMSAVPIVAFSSQLPLLPTEAELYDKHEAWFRTQRRSLLGFLAFSQGQPCAEFPLPLPLPDSFSHKRAGSSSKQLLYFSRTEILQIMSDYIGELRQAEQAEREHLAQANLIAKITLWRWQKQKQKGKAGANSGSFANLPTSTRSLLAVFGCLASGMTDTRQIGLRMERSEARARNYRQYLLDAVFFHAFSQVLTTNSGLGLSA